MSGDMIADYIDNWRPPVQPEATDMLSGAGYDADYVLEYDKEVYLDGSGPHQVTETDLISDPQWIEASRRLLPLFSDTPLGSEDGDLTDAEAAQWGLEMMGWFNYNIPAMGMSVAKIQNAPGDQKLALYYLMKKYDDKQIDWNGTKRFFKGLISDPPLTLD